MTDTKLGEPNKTPNILTEIPVSDVNNLESYLNTIITQSTEDRESIQAVIDVLETHLNKEGITSLIANEVAGTIGQLYKVKQGGTDSVSRVADVLKDLTKFVGTKQGDIAGGVWMSDDIRDQLLGNAQSNNPRLLLENEKNK